MTRDDGPWNVRWLLGARYFNFEERLTSLLGLTPVLPRIKRHRDDTHWQ